MEREGILTPETVAAARDAYEGLAPAARTVTREVTKAMEFDREEYDRRVTDEVVATARDALFASLLAVNVGTREEFEAWRADADREVVRIGTDAVDGVAWHAPPFADRAVAATFQEDPEAAVATLRRQAFGRIYREVLREG